MKPNKKRLLAVLIAAVSFTAVSAQRLITDYLNIADSIASGLIELSDGNLSTMPSRTVMKITGEQPKPSVNKQLAPGTVKYETSVGADGQLNVEIPIESFAAKFEADPGIALNYNGMSSASFMGDGWSITGLHAITPTERTIFTDGRCSGIDGDAVMHRQGLGFCGFSSIRSIDDITGDTTLVVCDPLNFGAPKFNSNRLEENIFEYESIIGSNKIIDIRLVQKTSFDKAIGKRSVTDYNYDDFRNVICESSDYGSGYKQIKRSNYLNEVSPQINIIGLPMLETTTTETGGQFSMTGQRTTYNARHLPETVVEFYGEENSVVKISRYTYDELCNLTKEEVKNYDSNELIEKNMDTLTIVAI